MKATNAGLTLLGARIRLHRLANAIESTPPLMARPATRLFQDDVSKVLQTYLAWVDDRFSTILQIGYGQTCLD